MDPFVINRCGSYASTGGKGEKEDGGETEKFAARYINRFKTGDRECRRPLIDTSPLIITSFPASRVAARARARDKSSGLVPTQGRICNSEREQERERERNRISKGAKKDGRKRRNRRRTNAGDMRRGNPADREKHMLIMR